MNATELADKLVEAGIGRLVRHGDDTSRYVIPGTKHTVSAGTFITDWRVAGKVLESMIHYCANTRGATIQGFMIDAVERMEAANLPRAIIEAWYEAQETAQ